MQKKLTLLDYLYFLAGVGPTHLGVAWRGEVFYVRQICSVTHSVIREFAIECEFAPVWREFVD